MCLLNVGIIYRISDSPWVSPTQVVPKKGGITIVENEKVLVPTAYANNHGLEGVHQL